MNTIAENMGFNTFQLIQAKSLLRKCMQEVVSIYSAIISTVDGNELVHYSERTIPTDRLATMNSSMLALTETLARESYQRLCRFVILENSDGRIVTLRINDKLLLTCVSSKDSNLGIVLNVGQSTAVALRNALHNTPA